MSEKHQKVKVITFNTNNHLERFLYDYANSMKEDKQSFSGLMKHLFVSYLTSTGNPPPGGFDMQMERPAPKKKDIPKKEYKESSSRPKMGGKGFFYDDQED